MSCCEKVPVQKSPSSNEDGGANPVIAKRRQARLPAPIVACVLAQVLLLDIGLLCMALPLALLPQLVREQQALVL